MALSAAASFSVQLAIALLIALIMHLATGRKTCFISLIGLQNPRLGLDGFLTCLALVAIYVPTQLYLVEALIQPEQKYDLQSPSGLAAFAIWSFFTTALCEELVFRGAIFKGLAFFVGKTIANVAQAAAFTALHGLAFLTARPHQDQYLQWAMLYLSVFVVSVLLVEINLRFGRGSILPSWLAHGLGNFSAHYYIFTLQQ